MASNTTVDPAGDSKELEEEILEDNEVNTDVTNTEEVSASDRYQQRLERFGKIAPEAKKISRALRFGTSHETLDDAAKKRRSERFGVGTDSNENDQDRKRQRAERFHGDAPTSAVNEETKQKRIDRFGIVTPPTKKTGNAAGKSTAPVLTEDIKKRVERFGDVSQVAKANAINEQKAKRSERFKPVTSV